MIKTKLLACAILGYSMSLWLLCVVCYSYLVSRACLRLVIGLGRFLGLDGFDSVFEALIVICDSVPPSWFLGIYSSIEAQVHDALKGWEYPPSLGRRIATRLFFRPPIITLSCPLPASSAPCVATDGECKRLEEHAADNPYFSLTSDGVRTIEVTGSETPDDELRSEANSSNGNSSAADTDFFGLEEQAGQEEVESDRKGEDLIDTDIESQADTEDGGVPLPVRLLAFADDKDDNSEHHGCNDYPTEPNETGELDSLPTPCSLGDSSCPVRNNMPEEAPIGNKEGPVSDNPSSEFDLPGTEKPPTPSTPSPRKTSFKHLATETNSMDFEETKAWIESAAATSLKLERLAESAWDETLAALAAGSEKAEAFTKAARAASQEMEALLKESAKAIDDLEQAKEAWIATSKVPTLEQLTDSLWEETLASIRASSEEAKAALRKAASTGDKPVEAHRSKDKPNKRRPKSNKPCHEPQKRNPDCTDPEKDFHDVCWEILKETNLVGVYMKDKMLREQLRKKHPKRRHRKEKSEKREKEPGYPVCCDTHRPIIEALEQ
ncbi:hypothetical protein BO78DRAFT_416181 [Aspergillus sclerotiicarbonarius CBS 121057]|uniref:Uncharacterized protein n=1 Tax=Aspergillus sclerotiicarbonarius (strain CBS 121057 / IBT 28362) TaxID=1448318 RepID=A0A319EF44_ASPSB|nr:hypothetical protein BO78DRAFT_416181 [Aspergillus sclerotiicarbonarius CBS 121057]